MAKIVDNAEKKTGRNQNNGRSHWTRSTGCAFGWRVDVRTDFMERMGVKRLVLALSIMAVNGPVMAPAFGVEGRVSWLSSTTKRRHLEERETEQRDRFSILSRQYFNLRDSWLNSAGPDQTSIALRSAFSACLTTAKDLQQLEGLGVYKDAVAEAAVVMQIDKDLSSFAEAIDSTPSGLLAH